MQILEHRCPECGAKSLAPMTTITPGDAGVWQCEACDNAYEINIEFRQVDPAVLEKKRQELSDMETSAEPSGDGEDDRDQGRAEEFTRRMLEIGHEIQRLQRRIVELETEAKQLSDEAGGD